MKALLTTILTLSTASTLSADPLACELASYTARAGLTATAEQDLLVVSWIGEKGVELRARYAVDNAQPVVRDLAIRQPRGQWSILGQRLVPEYHVTSGVRRMSEQQAAPLRALGVEITPEIIDKNRWYAFWDAPLVVPGMREGQRTPRNLGLPRRPEEIRRVSASFNTTSCRVKTDGARLEVTFPGAWRCTST